MPPYRSGFMVLVSDCEFFKVDEQDLRLEMTAIQLPFKIRKKQERTQTCCCCVEAAMVEGFYSLTLYLLIP